MLVRTLSRCIEVFQVQRTMKRPECYDLTIRFRCDVPEGLKFFNMITKLRNKLLEATKKSA